MTGRLKKQDELIKFIFILNYMKSSAYH